MARKRHSDEDVLKLLREIELKLAAGNDVASACRSVGISDATYSNWRKRFGGMGRSQLSEMTIHCGWQSSGWQRSTVGMVIARVVLVAPLVRATNGRRAASH